MLVQYIKMIEAINFQLEKSGGDCVPSTFFEDHLFFCLYILFRKNKVFLKGIPMPCKK